MCVFVCVCILARGSLGREFAIIKFYENQTNHQMENRANGANMLLSCSISRLIESQLNECVQTIDDLM